MAAGDWSATRSQRDQTVAREDEGATQMLELDRTAIDLVDALERSGGLLRVKNALELPEALRGLLADTARRYLKVCQDAAQARVPT